MKKTTIKTKMKKIVAAGMILIAGVGLLTGCGSGQKTSGSADAKELQTVRLAVMTGNFDHYTAVVGKEQGIFEKYGINLEITEYSAGINTIDAVANGTADIGNMANYAAVNRLGNTLHDTNLIIISELSSGGAENGGLYVAPEYADDLSKLDGSTGFITTVGTVYDYYNSQVFAYLGLDESKQNIVNSDSISTSLALAQNGGASAIYTTGANGAYFEEYGWKLAVPASELSLTTGAYFLTTKEYNEEHTELLAKWLQAMQESFEYIHDNLEETGEYLESTIGIRKQDFIDNWSSVDSRMGFSDEGVADLETMKDWAYEHGKFSEDYDVKDFINTEAAELAFPDRVTISE